MTSEGMNLTTTKTLLDSLEESPQQVQLHYRELERLIASCMDEVFALAKSGEDNDRKMELVGIEYRARLLLERYKKLAVN